MQGPGERLRKLRTDGLDLVVGVDERVGVLSGCDFPHPVGVCPNPLIRSLLEVRQLVGQ